MKESANVAIHRDRLQALDILRFIAAMCVMVYHMTYRPLFLGDGALALFPAVQAVSKFGYLGVELFFLISGFVILWSASGRSAASYVASRVSRLVPSLWVCIALTSAVLIAFGKAAGIVQPKVILANMTLVAGYVGLPYVDGVYWTLQAEIKFYVLVFILIVLRQMRRIEDWLVVWLVALAIAYASFAPGWLKSLVIFPYGSYFIGGSLFFLIWREGVTTRRLVCLGASLVLSLMCVRHEAAGFMNNDTSPIALNTASAIVVCLYGLVFAVSLRRVVLPESDLWFQLGALTYPLYLLHNQIGKLFAGMFAREWGIPVALVVGFTLPLILAFILARSVERKGCPWLRSALLSGARRIGLAT